MRYLERELVVNNEGCFNFLISSHLVFINSIRNVFSKAEIILFLTLIIISRIGSTEGEAVTVDFDLVDTIGFVKGDLKINGVLSSGYVQFCGPLETDPDVICGISFSIATV